MKKDRYLFGFYWQKRKLTIKQAAEFSVSVVMAVKNFIPEFEQPLFLNREGTTTAVSLENKEVIIDQVAQLLLKNTIPSIKKYHPGTQPSVNFSEPVGFVFNFSAESTQYNGSYRLSFIAGGYGVTSNNVLLRFPSEKATYDYGFTKELFIALNTVIKPDYSFISSGRIQEVQQLPEFFFGWMNYFSNAVRLPPIPADMEQEDINGEGKIIITTRDQFDALNNVEHYNKGMQLVQLFRQHNCTRLSIENNHR